MADQKRINGNLISWGSIKVKVDGETFYGFTSLSYEEKRERGFGWGMGRHHAPRGRSAGKYTPGPVKLGGPKSTMFALRKQLATKATDGVSYGNVEFEIVAQYIESNEDPITVEINQCVVVGKTVSEEESIDPMKEEIEISCMRIRENGLTLWDNTEGS